MANTYNKQSWTEGDVFTPVQANDISNALYEITREGGVEGRNIDTGFLKCGYHLHEGGFDSGVIKPVNIKFKTPFPTGSYVSVSVTPATSRPDIRVVSASNVSTTGFTLNMYNASSATSTGLGVAWIAIVQNDARTKSSGTNSTPVDAVPM